MGCDIHGSIEIKTNSGKWIELQQLDVGRNYDMFGVLADVRNYVNAVSISEPRGIPEDVSKKVMKEIEGWDCDGHSHSWLSWKDIQEYDWKQIFHDGRESAVVKSTGKELWKASYSDKSYNSEDIEFKFLDRTADELISDDWKEVFQVMSEQSKILGDENVRIVFWFDC